MQRTQDAHRLLRLQRIRCCGTGLSRIRPQWSREIERSIVGNVNFMAVPALPNASAGIGDGGSQPGGYVELRAARGVPAVMLNENHSSGTHSS